MPWSLQPSHQYIAWQAFHHALTARFHAGKCLGAGANAAFPSEKHPCAVRVTVVPPDGAQVSTAAKQCRELVKPLLQERVQPDELQRVKLQAEVRLHDSQPFACCKSLRGRPFTKLRKMRQVSVTAAKIASQLSCVHMITSLRLHCAGGSGTSSEKQFKYGRLAVVLSEHVW
jgi:hypothetical protein